jgi:hypothetical protein
VKYLEDLVLLAKEEMVLQGMTGRITKIGRYYGMEMNVENIKVMRISRQTSPVQVMIDQKQLENVKYINCFGSVITNDATYALELNPGLPWQNQHPTGRKLFLPAN